ncbi:MAG: 23S rRNA (uracil(1939)-C(5))-methyltransferase RlmD [Paludibacteraceae bacterium]|nr:23S rRNA (uracil(1939)-C(5))-methyltransferase RlmD [Paludibacteraceae bacterium]
MKKLPLLENITITDVAAEGKALAKVDDCVVFVPLAVPGDVCDLQVTKKKHSYMEARVDKLLVPSPIRLEPKCRHFGDCGGCKWQILPYDKQLYYKQKQVEDVLTRIGKVELPKISPIIGSERQYAYRNKLEFTFSDRRWRPWNEMTQTADGQPAPAEPGLGFHIPGMFDKVLDIKQCLLMDDINNRIRNCIKDFALQHGYSFFNLRSQTGLLRTMVIRTNSRGEVMLTMAFGEQDNTKSQKLLAMLQEQFPEIVSLNYVVNTKANDTIGDLEVHNFYGADCIIETMEDLQFKVGPKSFYQTNSEQAYKLYCVAREYAGLTGSELVYDLYTGTGTIAQFVAKRAKKVIGIEYVPEAIEDAKANAMFNGLQNTEFFAGDMKDVLTEEFMRGHGHPGVIITDPPRAGMHEDVVDVILRTEPKKIVYISCNPATQARDLAMLDAKYRVMKVQPVDMFPHTHHIENVVLLELKNEEMKK